MHSPSWHPYEDRLVWRGEATGKYSMMSGYKILIQDGVNSVPINNQSIYTLFHKKLWQPELLDKIKITNWKVFNNYIFTLNNLFYKRLGNSVVCPKCTNNFETLKHAFRGCIIVNRVQEKLGIQWSREVSELEYREWMTYLFSTISREQMRQVAYAIWAIWSARNKALHEGIKQSTQEIVNLINSSIRELKIHK